jgi:nucleotide-binding universal stress UspA family protein
MKRFKNIAVAIDFTATSTNTYNYAHRLAARFDADLTVIHVYDPLVYDYLTMPSVAAIEAAAQEQLSHFVHEDTHGNSDTIIASRVKVQTRALMGQPSDILIEYSKDPTTDLLILGTMGEHDLVDKFFGSVAVKVMQEAHCPVLLVPRGAEYKGIHHILYAASPDSATNKEVYKAIDFAEYFISALHFIHVDAVFEDPKNETSVLFKQILAAKAPRLPYSIERVPAATIAEGINTYCLTNPLDLIVTVTHHRSFWENLIHYSTSKELAWHARLPILCLHTNDNHTTP